MPVQNIIDIQLKSSYSGFSPGRPSTTFPKRPKASQARNTISTRCVAMYKKPHSWVMVDSRAFTAAAHCSGAASSTSRIAAITATDTKKTGFSSVSIAFFSLLTFLWVVRPAGAGRGRWSAVGPLQDPH